MWERSLVELFYHFWLLSWYCQCSKNRARVLLISIAGVSVRCCWVLLLLLLQEDCARVLMFRGADKELRNSTGHTAYQVAVAASYHSLADAIQKFKPDDVGERIWQLICAYCVLVSELLFFYRARRNSASAFLRTSEVNCLISLFKNNFGIFCQLNRNRVYYFMAILQAFEWLKFNFALCLEYIAGLSEKSNSLFLSLPK